jgi:hypothetical protein
MRWVAGWKPDLEQWVCFDTAFHATLPEVAATYAVPAAWRRDGLRRYGFHGLNHQHISEVVTRRFGARSASSGEPLRLISCHLGAGCSLCAVRGGRSIDTTMGFTPLEGLVMGTRSGSIDPGLILHQLRHGMGEVQSESNPLARSHAPPPSKQPDQPMQAACPPDDAQIRTRGSGAGDDRQNEVGPWLQGSVFVNVSPVRKAA